MKKTVFALAALLAAGTATEAFAGSIANGQTGQPRSRSIVYADPTDAATDTFLMEVDFVYPADQATAHAERQWAYVYFLRELATGDSGTMTAPLAAVGAYVTIEPRDPGVETNFRIVLNADPVGTGATNLGTTTIPYDNVWHRLGISVDGSNNVIVSIDGTAIINAVLPSNPGGEHYGILQRFNSAVATANVPHFDNFRFDGSLVNSFDADLGPFTDNFSNLWVWDSTLNSDYVPSSSVGEWNLY